MVPRRPGALSAASGACPCCGSRNTASRRQLFHALMSGQEAPEQFAWYDSDSAGACPPKSLAVILGLFVLAAALPAAGLWLLGHTMQVGWLVALMLALIGALLIDVLATYRRYRDWGGEHLCADCRTVFSSAVVVAQ